MWPSLALRPTPQSSSGMSWRCSCRPSSPGSIIARLGVFRVLWVGGSVLLRRYGAAVSASGFWGYWLALATLGLGWNFLFIGGTSLVAKVAEPVERGRVQGFADLVTMTTVAVASLFAGAIHSQLGWQALSLAALGAGD